MQVEIGDAVFFLLKDGDGNLLHTGPAGFEKTFSNVTPLSDTVVALKSRSVRFLPLSGTARYLAPGERVIRAFRRGSSTYCRTTAGAQEYGWVDFTAAREGTDWKPAVGAAPAETSISPDILRKIGAKVDNVNGILAQLFTFFNRETHRNQEIPRWTVDRSDKEITCTLLGTTATDGFTQSTRYLVNDVETIVLGTGLAVTHSPGRIEVRQK
jgi:hypothetical protein